MFCTVRISRLQNKCIELEVGLGCVEKVLNLHCDIAVPFWIGHIENLHFLCFWSDRLCAVLLLHDSQLRILHAEFSILLDGIVDHLSLIVHHTLYSHNFELCAWLELGIRLMLMLRLRLRLILTQVVTRTTTWHRVEVGSIVPVATFIHVVYFIWRKY